MGNINSSKCNDKQCLICWEQINIIDLVECTRCNIYMHAYCEETYRDRGGKRYCKCPHCQRVGTIGSG